MESARNIIFYWGGSRDDKQNLYVRSYGEFILIQPDRENSITPNYGEIFWPIDGQGWFRLGKKEYTLRPGYVWYYPPGVFQDYRPKNTFRYCWLTIAGPDSGRLFEMLNIQPGLNKAGICPRHLFNMVGTDINFLTKQHRLSTLATAFKILTLISEDARITESDSGKNIAEIKTYVETNCGNPELSVEQIAAEIGIHRGSLSRSFRKNFGVTISNYIISCRMKKASELLLSTNYPITQIAPECGMNSAHYFSKVFTRQVGLSPSEFRTRFKK